jgi:hypothetical protein
VAVDLDRVRKALRNLDGERTLRNLLGRELGYEHEREEDEEELEFQLKWTNR